MTNEQIKQFIKEHEIEEGGSEAREFEGNIKTTVWFWDNKDNHIGIVIENLESPLEEEIYRRFNDLYEEDEREEKYIDDLLADFLKSLPDFKRAYEDVTTKVSFIKSIFSNKEPSVEIPMIELDILRGIYGDYGFDSNKDIYAKINDSYILVYDEDEKAAYIMETN